MPWFVFLFFKFVQLRSNVVCVCIGFGVVYSDLIEFKFHLRPLREEGIGGDITMQVRAGAPSFCEGLVYAVAYTKTEIITDEVSKYHVSGFDQSLPGLKISEIPYDWTGGIKDIWWDFVIKEENKKGVEDDCEYLLVDH